MDNDIFHNGNNLFYYTLLDCVASSWP